MATITASSLSLENTLEELIKEFNNLSSDVESVTLETLITAASSQITFEGATEDDNETTLTATDPTADRTITLPDVTGTVVTTGNADAGATTTTFADLDHFLINDGGTLKKMAIATALSSLPALTPSSANANALGSAALEWSDLFLGDGSVINFGNNQDVTLTHVADTGLTLNLMMVATTFEPSADTAAGDNAAFGYTSVLGAIITGEGSTNDVTLVNDSDATVLGIPTGTVNVTMAGTLDVVGDVIGANFQPDGDTATGDNAAIGYTSVLGLILTGEGSTNDVTIVNDADTTVMGVATGTTTVNFAGQLNGGTIILAETDTDTTNTGNVTIDFSAHQNFVLTLTGNTTFVNPSTEAVGQAGVFVFIQDGTGSRTLSLGTDYESPAGGGITLSTAANAVDVVPYFVKAANSIQLGAPQLAFS